MLPALAVARALAAECGDDAIELVGARRGLEARLLPSAGMPYVLLPGRGIARRLTPGNLIRNLQAVAGLMWATVLSFRIIATRRPSVVVAVGGYASVPPSFAAVVCRVPLVVLNVDAVAGAANRFLGRFARASAIAYAGTSLPRAIITGAPVRPEVASVRRGSPVRSAARLALGLPEDRLVIAAFGGSLGARRINFAVADLAKRWTDRSDVLIYHVVGRRNVDSEESHQVLSALESAVEGIRLVQVPYEDRMELLYQAADIAVCRSGAMTVAELAVVGLPAVLVPLPGAPGDHQSANARVLERAGGALVLPDAQCTSEQLDRLLAPLLSNTARLAAMGRAAAAVGRADAAGSIAALAIKHAKVSRSKSAERVADVVEGVR